MELYQVSYQAQFKFDREELKKSLRKIIDDTKLRYEKGVGKVNWEECTEVLDKVEKRKHLMNPW